MFAQHIVVLKKSYRFINIILPPSRFVCSVYVGRTSAAILRRSVTLTALTASQKVISTLSFNTHTHKSNFFIIYKIIIFYTMR